MESVSELIFRHLTPADFFNINKRPGTEARGGGQSYIDISTRDVSLETWHTFFAVIPPAASKSGPVWTVNLQSLGNPSSQAINIGLRRSTNVNIRSQKLFSNASNRVRAWHPDHSNFPRAPEDMASSQDPRVVTIAANLHILLMKTVDDRYWAGWLPTRAVRALSARDPRFAPMLTAPAGHLPLDPPVAIDVTTFRDPFRLRATTSSPAPPPTNDSPNTPTVNTPYNSTSTHPDSKITAKLFGDDFASPEVKRSKVFQEVLKRNQKAVRILKQLYKTCQISGDQFVFLKNNQEPYLEAHHLLPLGDGGADNAANLVIVSAHIHRMLHYANVQGLDLTRIVNNELTFSMNGEPFTITWHPDHIKLVTGS